MSWEKELPWGLELEDDTMRFSGCAAGSVGAKSEPLNSCVISSLKAFLVLINYHFPDQLSFVWKYVEIAIYVNDNLPEENHLCPGNGWKNYHLRK